MGEELTLALGVVNGLIALTRQALPQLEALAGKTVDPAAQQAVRNTITAIQDGSAFTGDEYKLSTQV